MKQRSLMSMALIKNNINIIFLYLVLGMTTGHITPTLDY